jgi:hypothetical protein
VRWKQKDKRRVGFSISFEQPDWEEDGKVFEKRTVCPPRLCRLVSGSGYGQTRWLRVKETLRGMQMHHEVVDGLDLGTAGPMTLMMNLRLDLVKANHLTSSKVAVWVQQHSPAFVDSSLQLSN